VREHGDKQFLENQDTALCNARVSKHMQCWRFAW